MEFQGLEGTSQKSKEQFLVCGLTAGPRGLGAAGQSKRKSQLGLAAAAGGGSRAASESAGRRLPNMAIGSVTRLLGNSAASRRESVGRRRGHERHRPHGIAEVYIMFSTVVIMNLVIGIVCESAHPPFPPPQAQKGEREEA